MVDFIESKRKKHSWLSPIAYRLGVAHFSMLQALKILIFSYSLFVF